jgi:hypothetical protein
VRGRTVRAHLGTIIMTRSSAAFGREGITCKGCGEPFPVLWDMRQKKEVREPKLLNNLADPFKKKCPWCKHVDTYPKSSIAPLVSLG